MRIGIIGAGPQARSHADAIQALGHTIAYCATSRPLSFNSQEFSAYYNCPAVTIEQMIPADRLIVCTPAAVTEELKPLIRSLDMPVLVEKPFGLTLDDYDYPQASIGYNRRFYPTVQTVKQMIEQSGLAGWSFVVNELVDQKRRRLGLTLAETILYSAGHYIDLYLNYLKLDRCANGKFVFVCDNSVNTELRLFFKDGQAAVLTGLETLKILDGMTVTMENNNRTYVPRVTNSVVLSGDCKHGILEQMTAWLEDSAELAKYADERAIHQYINNNLL